MKKYGLFFTFIFFASSIFQALNAMNAMYADTVSYDLITQGDESDQYYVHYSYSATNAKKVSVNFLPKWRKVSAGGRFNIILGIDRGVLAYIVSDRNAPSDYVIIKINNDLQNIKVCGAGSTRFRVKLDKKGGFMVEVLEEGYNTYSLLLSGPISSPEIQWYMDEI